MTSLARAGEAAPATAGPGVLLAYGAGALALRVGTGGGAPGARGPALAFAAVLLAAVVAVRPRVGGPRATLAGGLLGGLVLIGPPAVGRWAGGGLHPAAGDYFGWLLLTAVVVAAEESFLRGAVFEALLRTGARRALRPGAGLRVSAAPAGVPGPGARRIPAAVVFAAVLSGRPDIHTGDRATGRAVLVTAVAFAALHVPFYGWNAFPLDAAVGLLLGGLRVLTGGWGAPAVAHTLADAAGWWLL